MFVSFGSHDVPTNHVYCIISKYSFWGFFFENNVVVRSNERMHYSKVLEITNIGIQRKNHNESNVRVLYLYNCEIVVRHLWVICMAFTWHIGILIELDEVFEIAYVVWKWYFFWTHVGFYIGAFYLWHWKQMML